MVTVRGNLVRTYNNVLNYNLVFVLIVRIMLFSPYADKLLVCGLLCRPMIPMKGVISPSQCGLNDVMQTKLLLVDYCADDYTHERCH